MLTASLTQHPTPPSSYRSAPEPSTTSCRARLDLHVFKCMSHNIRSSSSSLPSLLSSAHHDGFPNESSLRTTLHRNRNISDALITVAAFPTVAMGVRRLLAVARQCGRMLRIADLAGKAFGVDISVWCEPLLLDNSSFAHHPHPCSHFRIYRAASALTLDELRDADQRPPPTYVHHTRIVRNSRFLIKCSLPGSNTCCVTGSPRSTGCNLSSFSTGTRRPPRTQRWHCADGECWRAFSARFFRSHSCRCAMHGSAHTATEKSRCSALCSRKHRAIWTPKNGIAVRPSVQPRRSSKIS